MAKKQTDTKTQELIAIIKLQKAEIEKAERPNWKTNCIFSYNENNTNPTNLHVETDITKLITIAAFLINKKETYHHAATKLNVETPPPFQWNNSPLEDWLDDIKTRITKIQITTKKKKLENLENRLNQIISPELKAKIELENIEKELQ